MKRREFVKLAAGVTVFAGMRRGLQAQGGNPKIVFFGMCVVRAEGEEVAVFLPAHHNHVPFLAERGSTAISALGGTPVPTSTAGFADAHVDLGRPMSAWCLDGTRFDVGAGAAALAASLKRRLPSLSTMAKVYSPATPFAFPTASPAFPMTAALLRGGRLREPGQASRCAATFPGIGWDFYAGPANTHIGGPFNLTDLAVFESSTSTLEIRVGTRSHTMRAGDVIWLINMPVFHGSDNTPQEIRNAHDWLSLLTPAFTPTVVATTKNVVTRLSGSNEFIHPCASQPGAREAARKAWIARMTEKGWIDANSQTALFRYIPPDSDPCFVVAE